MEGEMVAALIKICVCKLAFTLCLKIVKIQFTDVRMHLCSAEPES